MEAERCLSLAVPQGIDVSHRQERIDWWLVAQSGMAFTFIRATEGLQEIDPRLDANWAGAGANGLLRGACHFYRSGADAKRQARNFLTAVEIGPGDLPPVLRIGALGDRDETVAGMRVWLTLVGLATGKTPILHTSPEEWSELGAPDFGRFPLWIADPGATTPEVPEGWRSWCFWQYSDTGFLPGVREFVALDLFRGTLPELRQMARGQG